MNSNIQPTFFARQSEFKKWLQKYFDKKIELLVGFYKVGSDKPSMTWTQSVDEALCFGWIDGVRKSIDHESYCIRFTPRKATSIWSAVNIKKIEELTKQKLMQPSGLIAFSKRKESKSKIYAYEKEPVMLDSKFEKKICANKKAWTFFQLQTPSYKKVVIHQIMTAKQEATQLRRLEKLITFSEAGKRLDD